MTMKTSTATMIICSSCSVKSKITMLTTPAAVAAAVVTMPAAAAMIQGISSFIFLVFFSLEFRTI